MNYKYTIFNLSCFIILRNYLFVPGLGDIIVKYIKHEFMKFCICPPLLVGNIFHYSYYLALLCYHYYHDGLTWS